MPHSTVWRVIIRSCFGAGLVLSISMTAFSIARASGGGPITLTVRPGGGLTLEVQGGIPAFTLDVAVPPSATTSRSYLSLPAFTARDLTGTGAGWHVEVQSTAVTAADGDELPPGSLLLTEPSVRCARTISCAGRASPPVVTGVYPAVLDGDQALTVASAAANTGMGTYNFQPGSVECDARHNLVLSTPPSSHPEEYSATLLISMISGP